MASVLSSSELRAQPEACSHQEELYREAKQALHQYVEELAHSDPSLAICYSHRFTKRSFTRHEAHQLLAAGVPLREILIDPPLLGGMEGVGEAIKLLKGAVELLVKGNKDEVRRRLEETSVPARVQLPNGDWIEGQHQGARTLSKGVRNNYGIKRYKMIACGKGEFHSRSVKYQGDFYNNLFHDHTGTAVYYITQDTRYTGSFSDGKRSGIGKLEKYNKTAHEFYTYFNGTWQEDQPHDGNYYAPNGIVIAHLQVGVLCESIKITDVPLQTQSTVAGVDLSSPIQEYPRDTPQTDPTDSTSFLIGGSSQSVFHRQSGLSPYPISTPIRAPQTLTYQPHPSYTSPQRTPLPADPKPRSPFPPPQPQPHPNTTSTRTPQTPFSRQPKPTPQSHLALPLRSPVDLSRPPEEACPLIARTLESPQHPLTLDESIELLTTCIAYGRERAKKLQGKQAIIVIGNTGAGKSTLVNYLSGCTLRLQSPEELPEDLDLLDDIVSVLPKSDGGTHDEIMPIGHTKTSKTFMPQIESDPEGQNTYCDCPGFLDNRGAEINIANAVNIKAALIHAANVRIVVLINYFSLKADRGRGLNDMLTICTHLFGHQDNLLKHKDSLLLGVTGAPLTWQFDRVKRWLIKDTPDIMQTLADRLFLYDPLDREIPGGWNRTQCLSNLRTLPPMENPSKIFRTVLTDTDEKKLVTLSEQMQEDIHQALETQNYTQAAERLSHLQNLTLIDHITVERLLSQISSHIHRHFQKLLDDFKTHCHFEHFSNADTLLRQLQNAHSHFPSHIDLNELTTYYQESETRYQERVAKEQRQAQELEAARGQIQQLLKLLEEQKQTTLTQLKTQEAQFNQMRREMQMQLQELRVSTQTNQQQLQQELQERLAVKEQELSLAKTLNQQEAQTQLQKEKAQLERDYQQKIKEAEATAQKELAQQQKLQATKERQMEAANQELLQKLQAIETQKVQTTTKLNQLPPIAFGKADWEKYFGPIDAEPPLPPDIDKILQGPCPIWEGKRVQDTHLLTLIPTTVNGRPLTLDSLSELIERPQGGGHATKYGYYSDYVKKELGSQSPSKASWALMTKDVIPNSRNKGYKDQKKLVRSLSSRIGLPYELPKAFEAAVSILMHHVKRGERLYTDSPLTWTRCQESVNERRWSVAIGGFAAGGLNVSYGVIGYGTHGVGVLRKF